jgi:protein tyrosine/serine phosphatase
VLRPLLGADETYLKKAFDQVTDRWGNFESYFLNSLGLSQSDMASLKERFLEENAQSSGRPGC